MHEVDVVEIELEVRSVRISRFDVDRDLDQLAVRRAYLFVGPVEPLRFHHTADLQERELLIGTPHERRAQGAVGHLRSPRVVDEVPQQPIHDLDDERADAAIVGDQLPGEAQAEEDAGVLVARGIAGPVVWRAVDGGGEDMATRQVLEQGALPTRSHRHGSARQHIIAGDLDQQFQRYQRAANICPRLARAGRRVMKGLGGDVVAGPYRGVAGMLVVDDLVRLRAGEDGVEDGAVRQVPSLQLAPDLDGFALELVAARFARRAGPGPGQRKHHRESEYA